MTAQILDGNALSRTLRAGIRDRVTARVAGGQRPPGLAVILVGDDPASHIYVRHKRKDCEEVGFRSQVLHLPADTDQRALADRVSALNADPGIDGILVQLPLPAHLDGAAIIDLIDPGKDVDGVHPFNIGRLALRRPALRCCTPKGVMQLLDRTGVPIRGLDATVIGASNHVGRPMGLELLLAGCTVTTAHKFSRDTRSAVATADIVVSAVGRPGLVRGDWIKPGAIVIDIGITRDAAGKLHGDVAFDEVAQRAGWITPVPGGVGPMTRAAMLQNTLLAAEGRVP
ncbi:MAG: bifunctional methylenetetrahydrofolate dehydrogenase/methenyltetrahydrofolate cyclohydrolase FolD [Pseudomonadales bacterium]